MKRKMEIFIRISLLMIMIVVTPVNLFSRDGEYNGVKLPTFTVAEWDMETYEGAKIKDLSGNDHDLTLNGAMDVPEDGTLYFDGINDYLDMGEMNVDYRNGFSYIGWVYFNDFNNWSRLFESGNGPANDNIVVANDGNTNNLAFHVYKGSEKSIITAENVLRTDEWMHIAATVDGEGNARLYVNGIQVGAEKTINVPVSNIVRTENYIGKSNWEGDAYFSGKMDEAAIYNMALTAEEIKEQYYKRITVAKWDMGTLEGIKIKDLSGNDHDLSLNGAMDGPYNGTLYFDGIDDYLDMGEMNVDYSNGFSYTGWVYFNDFNSWSRLFDSGNNPLRDNIVIANAGINNDLVFQVVNGGKNSYMQVNNVLSTDEWLHVAATVDGEGNARLYVNGIQVGEDNNFEVPQSDITRIENYIGKSKWDGDPYFSGKMDEAAIYNIALTAEQILDLSVPPSLFYGDYTISNQDDADQLAGYTAIGGNLTVEITSDEPVTLDRLNNLTYIGGNLKIYNNQTLESLKGLENLDSIDGGLEIKWNDELINLDELENLTHIQGYLNIWGNSSLINIDGLGNLSSVNKYLSIKYNNALVNINGLNNIDTIGNNLTIIGNKNLENLNGLSSLTSLGGYLGISSNASLTNLVGLENLTSIPGKLNINSNNALQNLFGLNNISHIGGDLIIQGNKYTRLGTLAGLGKLTSIGGSVIINGLTHLTSLYGLGPFSSIGGDLIITNNTMLPTSNAYIYANEQEFIISGTIIISGNKPPY